ncbi:hypothetical protein B0A55_06010 [Friedmanniomyces simplex]|uniref:NAD(P)-binding domain-containing protein n=1 Tax=Friedmanniomyces simplex TaxID=329884 RepID=A0A4U0XGM1_9PEZI|nr:hypothetical protein B0A55_06010 [Friedmanniomyces simplex]
MSHIILTGATGQAGAAVLAYALKCPQITRISILSRRPVKLAENEPKATVILHKDFEQYPSETLDQLRGATGCIWAQGISSAGMGEEEYTRITVGYPLAAAKAFASLGGRMNFVYMSGEGADISGKARLMFGRVKGRAERALLDLQDDTRGLRVYAVRPAIINPKGKHLAERGVTLQDRASTWLGNLTSVVWSSFEIGADSLAKVCVDLAVGDGEPVPAGKGVETEGRVLRNTALRRLAGL